MGHQHRIAAAGGQRPVAFVGERELGQDVAALQPEVTRRPGLLSRESPQAVPTWMAIGAQPESPIGHAAQPDLLHQLRQLGRRDEAIDRLRQVGVRLAVAADGGADRAAPRGGSRAGTARPSRGTPGWVISSATTRPPGRVTRRISRRPWLEVGQVAQQERRGHAREGARPRRAAPARRRPAARTRPPAPSSRSLSRATAQHAQREVGARPPSRCGCDLGAARGRDRRCRWRGRARGRRARRWSGARPPGARRGAGRRS